MEPPAGPGPSTETLSFFFFLFFFTLWLAIPELGSTRSPLDLRVSPAKQHREWGEDTFARKAGGGGQICEPLELMIMK